jgi:hypothetical protein
MNNLKRVGAAVVLTLALSLSTFAGEPSAPPCAAPDPGIIQSPPCAAQTMAPDDSAAPAPVETLPASDAGTTFPVADAAIGLLQSVLSLF